MIVKNPPNPYSFKVRGISYPMNLSILLPEVL